MGGLYERAPVRKYRIGLLLEHEPYLLPHESRDRAFLSALRNLIAVLKDSPTGAGLLRFAGFHAATAGLDRLLHASTSYYYPATNHLALGWQAEDFQRGETGVCRYLCAFIAGLRRIWHSRMGADAPLMLSPEDFIAWKRCEEADVAAVTLRIALELRHAGKTFLWRHLLSGADADMAALYQRTGEEDPQTVYDGRALRAAFMQWFADDARVTACDASAAEDMDTLLATGMVRHGRAFLPLERAHMQNIGFLSDGSNYLAGIRTGPWFEPVRDDALAAQLWDLEQDLLLAMAKNHRRLSQT
jgi:hypothetical protein